MEARKLSLLGQFWFFSEIQLQGLIVRLRTKSVPILLKILNAPEKILTKTPSEVAGEDGIDSDIDFKKKEQIVIFRGEKLLKKKILFPWQLAMTYT